MIRVESPGGSDEKDVVYVNPYAVDEIRVRELPYPRVQVLYRNGERCLMPQGVELRTLAEAVNEALERLEGTKQVNVFQSAERRMGDPL